MDSRSGYRYADHKVGNLKQALSQLRGLWGQRRGGSSGPTQAVRVTSALSLGLGGETAASLSSSEEINTTPTSYSTHGPDWRGGSSSAMTVGGVYDGSNGSQTLTFESSRTGIFGSDQLKVTVYDQTMRKLEDITINKFDTPETVYTLSNGLTVQFSAGAFTRNDTTTLDVYDSVGTSVDAYQPFDGVRLADPDLQPGLAVGDGSFTLNGTAISVYADDSIQAVLNRINASGAGVTAVFDTATESIRLEHGTIGSGTDIVLADDTSGFLAAMKLDAAVLVSGDDGQLTQAMADVPAFSAVSAGTLLINGVAVVIDPASDSLQNLIDRINGSGAGVTAGLDGSGQRLTIVSDQPGQALVLDDGGTGVFAALSIATGSHEPAAQNTERTAFSRQQALRMARVMEDISDAMNELLADPDDPAHASGLLTGLREAIRERIEVAIDSNGPRYRTHYGIQFDFHDSQRRVFTFQDADRSRFAATVQSNTKGVRDLLFGNGTDGDGLIGKL